jgi:hypothetical protein
MQRAQVGHQGVIGQTSAGAYVCIVQFVYKSGRPPFVGG